MKPKFKIGEKVWIIGICTMEGAECPICKGTGYLMVEHKGIRFKTSCPICSYGTIQTDKYDFMYGTPKEIMGYAFEKTTEGIEIFYKFSDWNGFSVKEEQMFKSRQDAINEIKRKNNELLEKVVDIRRKNLIEKLKD